MASVADGTSEVKQNLKRFHLLEELDSWKRSLAFYKQENSLLKFRLSDIVDRTEEENLLKTAEHYQNKFLQNDIGIEKIQQKILALIKELKNGETKTGELETMQLKQEKFRRLFLKFEQAFLLLENEFNENILKSIRY